MPPYYKIEFYPCITSPMPVSDVQRISDEFLRRNKKSERYDYIGLSIGHVFNIQQNLLIKKVWYVKNESYSCLIIDTCVKHSVFRGGDPLLVDRGGDPLLVDSCNSKLTFINFKIINLQIFMNACQYSCASIERHIVITTNETALRLM